MVGVLSVAVLVPGPFESLFDSGLFVVVRLPSVVKEPVVLV
jgi:hypothetical protein